MKQLRKSPKVKQILYDALEGDNLYSSQSFQTRFGMDIMSGKGCTVWGFDTVLFLVPDVYRKEWENGGKKEWEALYHVIMKVWNKTVGSSNNNHVAIHFIALAVPNEAIDLDPIFTQRSNIQIERSNINRGYTRYWKYRDGTMRIHSVVFHPSARIGVVAFHELMHAIMFATGNHTEEQVATPWGPSPLSEIICEFYGNCMDAYVFQPLTKRRKHLVERMKVYESQSKALVYLLEYETKNVSLESMNAVSYLCGTLFSMRKLLQEERIQWSALFRHPIKFLDNSYMRPTKKDFKDIVQTSQTKPPYQFLLDRSTVIDV